jgi:hypothetical protein
MGQLLDLACTERVAIMCVEGDYHRLHRQLLITQTLLRREISVRYIKQDGQAVDEERMPEQLSPFGVQMGAHRRRVPGRR